MNIGVKLKRLKEEDFIWLIYFFIVIAALYSNNEERIYYISKNKKTYKKAKTINIIVLTIAFFIYLYFVLIQTEDFHDFKDNLNNQKYWENLARLIAALLFLIGGIIYLVLEVTSNDLEEIGFI